MSEIDDNVIKGNENQNTEWQNITGVLKNKLLI